MEAQSASQQEAIRALLNNLEELSCDFSRDAGVTLAPLVAACISEPAARDAGWLIDVFESFGWDGNTFTRPVDVRAFASRVKALMFDGLQQKGQGSYATVYKARDRLTGEVITLKKVRIDEQDHGLSGAAIREISLLKDLQHPNIVKLKDVLWDNRRLYLIMEYLDCDLQEHIASCRSALGTTEVKMFLHQLLSGLHFCHSHRIIHRDLKPQNILVERKSKLLKIADFGLARCFTPPMRAYTHEVVTLLYRAPEILLGTAIYTTAVDVWSVGCIFAELFLARPLFQGDSEIGQLYKIFELLGTPDEGRWPGVAQLPDWQPQFPRWPAQDLHTVIPRIDALGMDLLRQLLCYDPNQRITARRALDHAYFGGLQAKSPLAPAQPAPPALREQKPELQSHPLHLSVRAVKLRDVCRSHSDPGLQRAELAAASTAEGNAEGIMQQQQGALGRSPWQRAEPAAPAAPALRGRTMQTRSMTAAQEAAEKGTGPSAEATGPLILPCEPAAAPRPAEGPQEGPASEAKAGRQRGKAKGRGPEGPAVATRARLAAKEEADQDGAELYDTSDVSDQTVCDVAEEVVPRRKGKA